VRNARVLVIRLKFLESLLWGSSGVPRHRPRWNESKVISRLSASLGFGEEEALAVKHRIEKGGSLPENVNVSVGNISKCLRPELTILRK